MKLGVVGTSEIVETFMQAVSYFPTLELKAVMSPRQSSIERFINKYGFEKGFTDFDELISNQEELYDNFSIELLLKKFSGKGSRLLVKKFIAFCNEGCGFFIS